ncbi:hypothetical protein FFM81_031495 (plasmid) [Rhizobium hidalgonense]|nr:hypothetical protein FFM81_031495 [Rhizobium hidalgonense]
MKLRPEHEYGKLATDIIQSDGWKSLPPKAGRARNRAIGRLMLRASMTDEAEPMRLIQQVANG